MQTVIAGSFRRFFTLAWIDRLLHVRSAKLYEACGRFLVRWASQYVASDTHSKQSTPYWLVCFRRIQFARLKSNIPCSTGPSSPDCYHASLLSIILLVFVPDYAESIVETVHNGVQVLSLIAPLAVEVLIIDDTELLIVDDIELLIIKLSLANKLELFLDATRLAYGVADGLRVFD